VEEAMKPYFDVNHVAFVLLLIVNMGWGAMELATTSNAREGATTIGNHEGPHRPSRCPRP
jgi:hypothetical protein